MAATSSGPGWASILTGVDADKHEITSNLGLDEKNPAYPTFLLRAHDHGLSAVVTTHWIGILELIEPEALSASRLGGDAGLTGQMSQFLTTESFDVHFIQLDDVDHTGHDTGFDPNNPAYISAIETIDGHIGELVSACRARAERDDEDWLVIVTTDHGGEGTSHGAQDAANQTVWLVVAGSGVQPGELSEATQMDVHPTLLHFLGIELESDWDLDGAVVGLP